MKFTKNIFYVRKIDLYSEKIGFSLIKIRCNIQVYLFLLEIVISRRYI